MNTSIEPACGRHPSSLAPHGGSSIPKFCLVLTIWGEVYPDSSVNVLVNSARQHSPELTQVILFTDRPRPEIDPWVSQRSFPSFFNRADFFGYGYRVKIGVFSGSDLPSDMPCVYLDLDTLVTGNLGHLAALIKRRSDVRMLPPGSLIGFGSVRRAIFRWTRGRRFATGNSSIMAFHSSATPNLAQVFEASFLRGESGSHMAIDDVFISWAGQADLQAIPPHLGVSFRREFLARTSIQLWLRRQFQLRQRHRAGIVAITFNGTSYKPKALLALSDGERIIDAKGRFGYWSDAHIGPVRAHILAYCHAIVAEAACHEPNASNTPSNDSA